MPHERYILSSVQGRVPTLRKGERSAVCTLSEHVHVHCRLRNEERFLQCLIGTIINLQLSFLTSRIRFARGPQARFATRLQTTKIFQRCWSEFAPTRRPLPQSVNRFCEFAAKREAGELVSSACREIRSYVVLLYHGPVDFARARAPWNIPHTRVRDPARMHARRALPLFAHACCDFFSPSCTI